MRNKLWGINESRWETFCLVFAVCLLVDKFQVSRGSQSGKLPASDSVLLDENVEEVLEVDRSTVESSEIDGDGMGKNFTRPWVPKCCTLNYGFTFDNKSQCIETGDEFLPDFADRPDYYELAKTLQVQARFEYYIGDPCSDGKYILDMATYPDDKYSIYSNGSLLYLDHLYSIEEFCLETLNGTIRAFICFGTEKRDYEINFTFIIYAIGLLISIPFLLATALVHLCVDMFRDLRGKSLSCHVLCLAIGYLVLAIVQLTSDQLDEGLCIAAGFIIQFFFVSSFCWLNVISYDTWRCIKNDFQCACQPNLRSEKIVFCAYSMYGWYAPVMLSIVTLIMDFEPAIPDSYLKPNFGLQSCWFYSDDAALPYFYGPVAFVIFVNIVFFFLSARKIYLEQKRREESLRHNNRNSLGQALLSIRVYTSTLQECIYLFCIMGINWAAEVLSWAVGGSPAIWLITDTFNALQGIMIFYLFVLKPQRVRNEVRQRLSMCWKRLFKGDSGCEEENKRISRHWHANIYNEMEEYCSDNERDKFLSQTNTTAV